MNCLSPERQGFPQPLHWEVVPGVCRILAPFQTTPDRPTRRNTACYPLPPNFTGANTQLL